MVFHEHIGSSASTNLVSHEYTAARARRSVSETHEKSTPQKPRAPEQLLQRASMTSPVGVGRYTRVPGVPETRDPGKPGTDVTTSPFLFAEGLGGMTGWSRESPQGSSHGFYGAVGPFAVCIAAKRLRRCELAFAPLGGSSD
jgi:hypothetical protein